MKSLKHYIMESVYTYKYRIHIAGDIEPTKVDLLKYNLEKFSPVKIGEIKSTPIQKSLVNFPNVTNERVNSMEVEFRYPATEPMVKQLAQLLGIDENRIRMFSLKYDDSINSELQGYENQMDHSPVLTHEKLEQQDGAKQASKDYGDSYLKSIKDQTKDSKMKMQFDGKKTPSAFDPFKPYLGDPTFKDSPMSKITRPDKPKTGAMS